MNSILLCLKNINPDRFNQNGTSEFSLNCIRYLWTERDMGMLAKSVIPNEVRDIWGALQIGVSYSRKSVSTWNLKWINNVIRNCVSQQWKQFTWINKYTSNPPSPNSDSDFTGTGCEVFRTYDWQLLCILDILHLKLNMEYKKWIYKKNDKWWH